MQIKAKVLYNILCCHKCENFIFIDGSHGVEIAIADDDDEFAMVFQDVNTEKYYRVEYTKWNMVCWERGADDIECEEVFPHKKIVIVFENFKQY